MSYLAYVGRRTLFALLAVYLVVSVTFLVVALVPNTDLGGEVGWAVYKERISAEEREAMTEQYLESRNLDRSLAERYVDYLVDLSTLQWGYSFEYDRPVADVVVPAIQRTALYALPALALAVLIGSGLGALAGALRGLADGGVRALGYAAAGVPAFLGAFVFLEPVLADLEWLRLLTWEATGTPFMVQGSPLNPNDGLWPPSEPLRFLAPAAVFAVALAGWQLRYVRTAYLDRAGAESVKLHRAKGAGPVTVARRVLRNAAVPIVSASLSELLAVVFVNLYVVESVFGIQGVAAYNMIAVRTRDVPLVVVTSVVLAVAGILASYAQDLAYGYLDPRLHRD
ncbi:ABC transporter permease [Halobacterium yunchengense]|uniref:ABC transporter permease n=1 Tax=Halobacterium yunchengense TaxID=3108497 RepID=UPI003008E8FA